MKRLLIPLASTLALGLAACNDNASSAPRLSIPTQSGGAYTVLAGGDGAGFGEAFYDASGNAFLVLSSDDRTPASILYTVDKGVTTRTPAAAKDTAVTYSSTSTSGYTTLDVSKLAATYQARVAGENVVFALDANGKATAGGSSCKLNGAIDASRKFGTALAASLSFSGCSGISGNYSGIAFARSDSAPAAFRIVAANGSQIVDFFVYP